MSQPAGEPHKRDDAGASRSPRLVITVAAVALVLILAGAGGVWAVSSHQSQVRAEEAVSSSQSASKHLAEQSSKEQTQQTPSPSADNSQTSSRDPAQATSTSAPQPDPGAPQPNPGGECAQYQGTYSNPQLGNATVVANCSIAVDRQDIGSGHIVTVSPGAAGVNGPVDGALDLTLEPEAHHLVVFTLFPKGVAAGYPGEDVSHNRLVNHSGGPVSAMSYQDFLHFTYIMP